MTDNETLVTTSGIVRNRSKPRVGIVNASSLYDDLFQDCLNDGIDLTWEEYKEDFISRIKSENPNKDESEIDELFERESQGMDFPFFGNLNGVITIVIVAAMISQNQS